jgi:NAD(P)H-dependent FMN reductase
VNDLYIPTILGTARPGRLSEPVAHRVVERLKHRGAMTDLIDVADYGLTATATHGIGLEPTHYRELVTAADGLLIVAPEYNHGYPGELKLLLDLEYQAYARKPVGFVSVSSGALGGTRMVEQLRAVTLALRMVPVSPAVHVVNVTDAVTDGGEFVDESAVPVIDQLIDEMAWYAQNVAPRRW